MWLEKKVTKFWYSQSWLSKIFWPLSWPFLFLVKLKRFAYQQKILKSNKAAKPVIIIGNISIGGTGKTPMIGFLIKKLTSQGLKVGVISRGYQSQVTTQPHLVNELDDVIKVGDEAYMQYHQYKVPMAIGKNRLDAANLLIKSFDLDVILSDDGMQHYSMGRDVEILMVDGLRLFGNKLVLPFGPLREPVSRLKTVDWIVQTGGDFTPDNYPNNASYVNLAPVYLVNIKNNQRVELNKLKAQSVIGVCGIGNPKRFESTLRPLCNALKVHDFPDHHQFKESDFKFLKANDLVVMTQKDAVKCQSFALDNWYYLQIDLQMDEHSEKALMAYLLSKIS
ncbi:tetraacyldisaccharide 4'-kinase [Aliikangiella sp. IMCC44653]